jgi:hypothetical protein
VLLESGADVNSATKVSEMNGFFLMVVGLRMGLDLCMLPVRLGMRTSSKFCSMLVRK